MLVSGCGYYLWLKLTGLAIPCMFRKVTGWLCPGCGITTLIMDLAVLDFAGAYNANPFLFVTGPILILGTLYDVWIRSKGKSVPRWMTVTTIIYVAALCIFGVLRNI